MDRRGGAIASILKSHPMWILRFMIAALAFCMSGCRLSETTSDNRASPFAEAVELPTPDALATRREFSEQELADLRRSQDSGVTGCCTSESFWPGQSEVGRHSARRKAEKVLEKAGFRELFLEKIPRSYRGNEKWIRPQLNVEGALDLLLQNVDPPQGSVWRSLFAQISAPSWFAPHLFFAVSNEQPLRTFLSRVQGLARKKPVPVVPVPFSEGNKKLFRLFIVDRHHHLTSFSAVESLMREVFYAQDPDQSFRFLFKPEWVDPPPEARSDTQSALFWMIESGNLLPSAELQMPVMASLFLRRNATERPVLSGEKLNSWAQMSGNRTGLDVSVLLDRLPDRVEELGDEPLRSLFGLVKDELENRNPDDPRLKLPFFQFILGNVFLLGLPLGGLASQGDLHSKVKELFPRAFLHVVGAEQKPDEMAAFAFYLGEQLKTWDEAEVRRALFAGDQMRADLLRAAVSRCWMLPGQAEVTRSPGFHIGDLVQSVLAAGREDQEACVRSLTSYVEKDGLFRWLFDGLDFQKKGF